MDPSVILLLVFMVYSVLLGVCLARMRAINRELDTMRQLFVTIGTVQRDASMASMANTNASIQEYASVIEALKSAMDGGVNG